MQKGVYAYHGFRDYERARTEFELARRTLPNDARLYRISAAWTAGRGAGKMQSGISIARRSWIRVMP